MFKYYASFILLLKQIVLRFYITCLANIIQLMVYYCTVHNIVLPRTIRNKSLPINLTEMTEENELKISYEYRICLLKEVGGLLRIDVEVIQNIARKLQTRARIARTDTDTPN